MNYHSDEWIKQRVQEHYKEALTIFPQDKILGIFLQGSQNYGLDYSGSDVDTKCIVLPTLEDACLNRKAVSYTYVRANNEHIDFKDLRVIAGDFKKQNINFLEILFTPYCLINKDYASLFEAMYDWCEDIARYDNYRFVKSVAGMSMEKHKALELDRPSQHDEIVKYGWATKQLHHIIRLHSFLKRWTYGEFFVECLIDLDSDYLVRIKREGHKMFTLEEAREMARVFDEETNAIKEQYIATNEHEIDEHVGQIIDNVVVSIIRECLKKEIG